MNNNQNNNRRPRNNNYDSSNDYNKSGNINKINNINRNQNYSGNNIDKTYNSYTPVRRTVPYRFQPRRKTPFLIKYGVRFLLFLFFFVVVGGIGSLLFFLHLTKISAPPEISYTINTPQLKADGSEKTDTQNISLSYDTGYANDQYYFPINDIMQAFGFVIAGNENDYSFIREKPQEYIKLKIGTNVIYINDEEEHMSAPSFLDKDNKVYVPLEFLQNNFNNLKFSFDDKNKNHITVDVQNISDLQPCFNIHQLPELTAVEEDPAFGTSPVTYKSDVSAFEKYFDPPADKLKEYLVLINQTHQIQPIDYIPPDLTDVADTRKDNRAMQQMRLYPEKSLEAFLMEARANGFPNVTVTSAYRSYTDQVDTFNAQLASNETIYGDKTKAKEMTSLAVADPGHSEHQTGLAVDMHSLGAAAELFGSQPDGKWLAENAHYFGFIVRYPDGKTDITGIEYEPWHFRYVGRYYATKIYESGLCYEEYYDQYLKDKAEK